MASRDKLLGEIRASPTNVRYADLARLCEAFFGEARRTGGSDAIYKTPWKTPWPGDPRVNIQNDSGKAKTYQVRQVLQAIDKLLEAKG